MIAWLCIGAATIVLISASVWALNHDDWWDR